VSVADGGHRDAAVAAIASRDYRAAGDEYTRAARRILADPRDSVDPFDLDRHGWVGVGLGHLVTAAICYRATGSDDRASHRAVEGIGVARDLEGGVDHPVQTACLREFVADFRVVGGFDGVEEAYEDAAGGYEDAGDAIDDPRDWATTPLFQAAIDPLKQAARGPADGEIAIAWEDVHGPDPAQSGAFLAHRVRYKRQRFPQLVERAAADGVLAAPRGTTEYDTDHHRCPHCGSTDVNWVADSTLCLRCSQPTAPT